MTGVCLAVGKHQGGQSGLDSSEPGRMWYPGEGGEKGPDPGGA